MVTRLAACTSLLHQLRIDSCFASVQPVKLQPLSSKSDSQFGVPEIQFVFLNIYCFIKSFYQVPGSFNYRREKRQDDLAHLSGVLVKAVPTYN
ncbi:Proteinase-activated receptor [Trichinella pseudospiralis]